jgi:acyl carrier protein
MNHSTGQLAPAARTQTEIEDWLTGQIASLTNLPADEIDPRLPIADFDLDSSVVVSLTQSLAEWLGIELEITILWEYPNIESIAAALTTSAAASSEQGGPR